MSERIEIRRSETFFRNRLLNTVSALVLVGYVSLAPASATDSDHPTVWIELGGQMEVMQGASGPFIAPFMTAITPAPDVYTGDIFGHDQGPARISLGEEGEVSFQPENSSWIISAGIRYGRSNNKLHSHQQGDIAHTPNGVTFGLHSFAPFADEKSAFEENHAIIDFRVGKDVGLGRFGSDGSSVFSLGVRFAQFSSKSAVDAMGRPVVNVLPAPQHRFVPTFYNYTMAAHAARSFRGIGPSLSWDASAAIAGNKQNGEVSVDWGINGAVLFGRQKAKIDHTTQAYRLPYTAYANYIGYYYTKAYTHPHHVTRSRSVVVPNLGGFAGVSVKYPNVKVSLGYRADFFFGAMDGGIDTAKRTTTGFYGPFASVSIGIGG
jgi:iron complex outermembrane receptor protein